MTTYIFNGKTYNDALLTGANGKGYAVPTLTGTGITVPYYIAAMVDAVADAGKGMKTQSVTSLSATVGSKTITMTSAIPYSVNAFLQITSRGDPDAYMFGQVVSVGGTGNLTLTFDAQVVGTEAGPFTDWDIMPSGTRGATGPAGTTPAFASSAEVNTGTETAKVISPAVLSDSNYGLSMFEFYIPAQIVENGAAYFQPPVEVAGQNIVDIRGQWNGTIGTGAATSIQLRNTTQAADVLSTNLTIDAAERSSTTAAVPPVIDTAEDDITSGDIFQIDIDVIGSTLPGTGLLVQVFTRIP